MDTKKLEKWANLLLDIGKRNNLINFKDTNASTIEIVLPNSEELFEKVDSSTSFEVFDPKIMDEEEDDYRDVVSSNNEQGEIEGEKKTEKLNRKEYIETYATHIKKNNQIFLYNSNVNPVNALKKLIKRFENILKKQV